MVSECVDMESRESDVGNDYIISESSELYGP